MPPTFSHLLGLGRSNARADDPEKDDTKQDDATKKKARRAKAEDGDTDDLEDDKADEADDAVADPKEPGPDGDDVEDEEQETSPKVKRAKKSATAADDDKGDDDSDSADERDPKAHAARGRERARCAAIFDSPYAAANLVAASHIAFGTALPRSQALSMLAALCSAHRPAPAAAAAPIRDSLRQRMASEPTPAVGSDAAPLTGANATAAAIVAAGRKRRGEI